MSFTPTSTICGMLMALGTLLCNCTKVLEFAEFMVRVISRWSENTSQLEVFEHPTLKHFAAAWGCVADVGRTHQVVYQMVMQSHVPRIPLCWCFSKWYNIDASLIFHVKNSSWKHNTDLSFAVGIRWPNCPVQTCLFRFGEISKVDFHYIFPTGCST